MSLRRSIYKTPAQLRLMVAPGLATAASLDAARALIRVGATTLELDAAAEAAILARGGKSNFKLEPGYGHTVCASVNDDVVHGIPSTRVLEPGDIVSIDSGAVIAGWNGDAAFSVVIPDHTRPGLVAERRKLSDVTEQSLWHGILTDYIGHGIGKSMHEAPPVFNYRVRQKGPDVKPGLVVAIEPMVVLGDTETYVRSDDWTVATSDGKAAAHWEHSVAVHKDGIWVLTAEDGGAAGLAPLGIVPVPIPA